MDIANRIALLSCFILSVSCVDAEVTCSIAILSSVDLNECCTGIEVNINCVVNTTVNNIPSILSNATICHENGYGNDSGSGMSGLDMTCMEIEMALGELDAMTTYRCNCSNLTCSPVSSITCIVNTITISPMTTTPIYQTTTDTSTTSESPTAISDSTSTTLATTTSQTTTDTSTTSGSSVTIDPTSTTSATTESTSTTLITTLSTTSGGTVTVSISTESELTMVLWIVLGCLLALIIITLCAIFLVSFAHCRRRYKKKKQPTALDIISKWEDTPNESSDIQLLSMKAIEEGEDKDGEEQKNGGTEEKEGEKAGLDERSDKVEIKEASKEDDITVGTFGFADKAAESTASKAESPTSVTESERKEDESKKDEATKGDMNEKLVEVTIEKAGEESATNTGSKENPTPDNKSVTGTDTTVPTEKEKAQEETKLEPVPVQIPLLGEQVADEKAPDSEHTAEVKTPDQSDKPASPSKDQAVKPETSPSSNKDVLATESVSKEPETAATITKPQTEDVKTVSLASDKPASSATGGLSLFTNEDMEKALGAAATLDLGQVESTQL